MFAKEKLYAQMGLQRSRADKRLKKRWANVPKKPENTFFKHVRYKEHCNLNVFLIFSKSCFCPFYTTFTPNEKDLT